ncbi:hypothetical protein E3E12_04140 [Formicincola oecophyllae]|uniref:ABC transporter substrate-binding protein n=1 Tax=Formicincola oecophyllae TaxID=2558361 RepID=A0A4Y6U7X0_9PROT|nr:zinc ABC transporter substrate-binding protein [Formicincola oecophyllae]QDH13519.1 hypothetical protein E3E12_04140 [Formicincola oecophyllae]
MGFGLGVVVLGVGGPAQAEVIPAQATPPSPQYATRNIACVERVWCTVAQAVGGEMVASTALIQTPGIDPHDFRASPMQAREIAQADTVLLNGAGMDDWALPMTHHGQGVFVAATLGGWRRGQDPHLFFDPETVARVAKAFAGWLEAQLPARRQQIAGQLDDFLHQVDEAKEGVEKLRKRFRGAPVAEIEPVAQRLLDGAGLVTVDRPWAMGIMTGSGVTPRETAALMNAINHRRIRLLVNNPADSSAQTVAVAARARAMAIPLVVIGENPPAGVGWGEWLEVTTASLDQALRDSAELRSLDLQIPDTDTGMGHH